MPNGAMPNGALMKGALRNTVWRKVAPWKAASRAGGLAGCWLSAFWRPCRCCMPLSTSGAFVESHQGQTQAATNSLVAAFTASETLSREPLLVAQAVRVRIDDQAIGALETLLPAAGLNDAQLAALQRMLVNLDYLGRACGPPRWENAY